MPSQVYKRGPVTAEMNITPLIDVTFLLIIFFMLVNNIIGEELAPMMIPEPVAPKTQALVDENRLVVNVVPQPGDLAGRENNPLMHSGEAAAVKVGIEMFGMDELDRVGEVLREAQAANPDLKIVLRADAALYYEEVQPVMMALTQAGVGTVNLAATMPEDAPAPGRGN